MKHFLVRFRAFCVSSFPLVAFFLVVFNFFISFSIVRSLRPNYQYKSLVVTNTVCSVVTNFLASDSVLLSSSIAVTNSSLSSQNVAPREPPRYSRQYRYFVSQNRRMCYMDGTYYGEGDVCSRGIMVRIFPDCIYLHDGSVIENSYTPRVEPERLSVQPLPSLENYRRKQNDR